MMTSESEMMADLVSPEAQNGQPPVPASTGPEAEPDFNFDLVPKQKRVTVTDTTRDGTLKKYNLILTEASEEAAVKFRNMASRALRVEGQKLIGIGDNIGDIEPAVLSLCLFESVENKGQFIKRDKNGKRISVPDNIIRGWPVRVVKPLFEWVKENSELQIAPTSEDQLRRQIARLQEHLAKLEEAKMLSKEGVPPTIDGTDLKNEHSATTGNSV